ncbi:MAG: aa3-type cytochrome c oxidase subunit IV [Marinosulfonomonas sp.]|nr:MAG: aa3-type cytochrome c oxidase subunit IV [Marinosulfonomonas sp.]
MAEFEHGSMEIAEQEKTFNSFLKFAGYGMLGALVFLFLLGLVNG